MYYELDIILCSFLFIYYLYPGIDTFELWCWRKLFRVPWTARRSNQSILKKISPEYSLEGLQPQGRQAPLSMEFSGQEYWSG